MSVNKQQKVFDRVVRHLAKQGGPSLDEPYRGLSPVCLYRADNGRKCAIGVLIPNRLYNPTMEEKTVQDLVSTHPDLGEKLILMTGGDIGLLHDLQEAHDSAAYKERDGNKYWFLKRPSVRGKTITSLLSEVAKIHGLSFDKRAFRAAMRGAV